jgi:hypothetical protein
VLGGAGLGLLWGVAARLWMRLISIHPEFSIFGTAAILIIATLFGAFAGLAFAARRRGWRRWGHYGPRILAIIFFIPFGAFGGMPLMLTVLVATLAVTQRAVMGAWVVAGLAFLVADATDFSVSTWMTNGLLAGAIVLTVWKIIVWRRKSKLLAADVWVERLVRTGVLLLAAYGFWSVASDIMKDKPGWLGLVCASFYLVLLYALFLGLRVGLEPNVPAGSRAATPTV